MRSAFLLSFALLAAGCTAATEAPQGPWNSQHLLWSRSYPTLSFDVDHVAGAEPAPAALASLVEGARLVTVRERVDVLGPSPIAGTSGDRERRWTHESASAFVGSTFPGQPTWTAEGPVVHVVYLNGLIEKDGRLIYGFASGTTIIVFPHAFRPDADVPGQDRIERAVLLHEFGHSMGLVGCGAPALTPRQTRGCHSSNEQSVMYADIDSDAVRLILDNVDEGAWIDFEYDRDDLRDLAVVRERDPMG